MRNGYALGTAEGLTAIGHLLDGASEDLLDALRGQLAIGLHRNVEVTDGDARVGGCHRRSARRSLGVLAARRSLGAVRPPGPGGHLRGDAAGRGRAGSRGGSNTVLLTRVGGGVFGNGEAWIDGAIERAMEIVDDAGLDISIVGHGGVDPAVTGDSSIDGTR